MRSNRFLRSVSAAVERLEGRVLLSTYTVTNLKDAGGRVQPSPNQSIPKH
jgi:hypothetical protein